MIPTTASGVAPLDDGVTFFGSIVIRELRSLVDLVVYFNNPINSPNPTGSIAVNYPYSPGPMSVNNPTGSFPGLEGRDYLRFEDVVPIPTTLGIPPLPGVDNSLSDIGFGMRRKSVAHSKAVVVCLTAAPGAPSSIALQRLIKSSYVRFHSSRKCPICVRMVVAYR